MAIFEELGVLISMNKLCGPATEVRFLDLDINMVQRRFKIPKYKTINAIAILRNLAKKKQETRGVIQRNLLTLFFLVKAFKQGRAFSISMVYSLRETKSISK